MVRDRYPDLDAADDLDAFEPIRRAERGNFPTSNERRARRSSKETPGSRKVRKSVSSQGGMHRRRRKKIV